MEKTCRICLNTSSQLYPLFADSKLITAIEIISSIQMQEVENYPNQICEECVNKINIFYLFRQTIISSDKEIRKKLFGDPFNNSKDKISTVLKATENLVSVCRDSCDFELSENDIKIEVNNENCNQPKFNVIEEEDCKIYIEDTKIEMDIEDSENLMEVSNNANKNVSVKQEVATRNCNICGKTVRKSKFSLHLKFHSNIPAKCDICGKLCKNEAYLKTHKYIHTRKEVTCHQCGKTYKSRHYLKEHFQKKHNNSNEEVPKDPTRVCNICGKSVGQKYLLTHLNYHIDAPVKCDICGKLCKNKSCLRDHINVHKRKELNCQHCGKIFKSKQHFNLHTQQHNNISPPKKHKCYVCEKAFFLKETFNRHLRTHTGEKPYVCEFCEKGFTSRHALTTHRRQHTNEKPYKCDLCEMAYRQKVSLVTHMKSKHSQDVKKQI